MGVSDTSTGMGVSVLPGTLKVSRIELSIASADTPASGYNYKVWPYASL